MRGEKGRRKKRQPEFQVQDEVLVREGIITITNNLFTIDKELAPAKHFTMVFISNSVGQVGFVVSILGLREERERGDTQQAK